MATHVEFLLAEYERVKTELEELQRKPDVSGEGGGVKNIEYRRELRAEMKEIVDELDKWGYNPDGTSGPSESVTEMYSL